MLRPRLIASLLVDQNLHLVKTRCFQNRHYLGDPLNAAYVFSGFEVDELLVLDIDASRQGRCISPDFVAALSRFTRVPLSIGGGITSLNQIHDLLALGVEKVVISQALHNDFHFLAAAAERFGSSTISVLLNLFCSTTADPLACFGSPEHAKPGRPLHDLALEVQQAGAGELLIHDCDREGLRCGFNQNLFATLNDQLSIPLVALGGCGEPQDIIDLLSLTPLSGVAVGSLFTYAPASREVLLNYLPTHTLLTQHLPALQEVWR